MRTVCNAQRARTRERPRTMRYSLRIMLVKDGEYNSLWQLVGDLKSRETKLIALPPRPRQSIKETTHQYPSPTAEPLRSHVPQQMTTATHKEQYHPPAYLDQTVSTHTKSSMASETRAWMSANDPTPTGDHRRDGSSMSAIEEHQKRHTFAPNLLQAQQNYRELRRLLRKMNGPVARGKNVAINRKKSNTSTHDADN